MDLSKCYQFGANTTVVGCLLEIFGKMEYTSWYQNLGDVNNPFSSNCSFDVKP